ncbi:MAG: hypothetical protein GF331_21350, partial [Chitinivibrionales bacterium]|nr:hypothetical protein [Chitinivibrionales bacterium]
MSMPTIVCPFNRDLLSRLGGHSVAVTVDSPDAVIEVPQACADHGCSLKCVRLRADGPLASVPFAETWRSIPLAISVPAAGRVRDLTKKLPLLRTMRMYVYLRSSRELAVTDARILSSLGLPVVIEVDPATPDWDL